MIWDSENISVRFNLICHHDHDPHIKMLSWQISRKLEKVRNLCTGCNGLLMTQHGVQNTRRELRVIQRWKAERWRHWEILLRKLRGAQKRISLKLEMRTNNNHSKEIWVHASSVLFSEKIIRVSWTWSRAELENRSEYIVILYHGHILMPTISNQYSATVTRWTLFSFSFS